MSNKKQITAVEYFDEQIKERTISAYTISRNLIIKISLDDYIKIKNQAKQMEKEQSKQDYDSGLYDGTMDEVKDRLYKNAEQYYNKTYGKE